MSFKLDVQQLQRAFHDRPDIVGAIQQAAGAPNWIELFNEISGYVSALRDSVTSSEPASKRRKIDEGSASHPGPNGSSTPATKVAGLMKNGDDTAAADASEDPSLLQIKDISIVVPQRKKYTIDFTASHIRARNPTTNEVVPGISYAWKDIAYAFCLPVPEKTQKQYNYILFPTHSNIPTKSTPITTDPLVFTIPATAPKPGAITGPEASAASAFSDTHKDVFDHYMAQYLRAAGNNVLLVQPDESQFASAIREAHRPGERALWTRAFRGSKDGYLFFLATGVLFGFKKPLIFLPKEHIVAVSYTSVLQRTFNLNVEVYVGAGAGAGAGADDDKEEFEFSMLDQDDFAALDTYIKRHGLQDASMAEQRRAKRLGINAVKAEDGTMLDAGDAGELAKAQQELQGVEHGDEDDEDEEGEDYDPGSEGESEGSGSSSEDEDEDGEGEDEGDDSADEDEDEENGDADEDVDVDERAAGTDDE